MPMATNADQLCRLAGTRPAVTGGTAGGGVVGLGARDESPTVRLSHPPCLWSPSPPACSQSSYSSWTASEACLAKQSGGFQLARLPELGGAAQSTYLSPDGSAVCDQSTNRTIESVCGELWLVAAKQEWTACYNPFTTKFKKYVRQILPRFGKTRAHYVADTRCPCSDSRVFLPS